VARFDFHGLTVETSSAFPFDPAARLLAPLPAAPANRPAAFVIHVASATPGDLEPRLPGPDAFDYGANQVRISGQVVELRWPGARTTVNGTRVDLRVDPEAMATAAGQELISQGPLLVALAVALRSFGCYHLHAAALLLPGMGTILIPATSGSGKSTLATALVLAGAGFLGDDTLFVRREGAGVKLLAMARDFHLSEASAKAMGLTDRLDAVHQTMAGKGRFDAAGAFPERFRPEADAPAFMLLPRITGAPATRLEPAGPSAALGALLESSVLVATRGLPGGPGHLPVLADLANGAATFQSGLGLDLLSDPAGTARRILERLRAP
jgi:hypothetical protein